MNAPTLPTGIWHRESIAELKRSWRLPQFILPTVITPAAFYGLFALAMVKEPNPAMAAASLAGSGVFAAIGPAVFGFGAGVAMEREQGLIELKRVSPLPASAYVTAKMVSAIGVAGVAIGLVDVLAIVAGVRLDPMAWLALIAIHIASTIPFALIGFGMGMRLGGKGAVAAANALFLGSAVLGGLWFPSAILPKWMQAIGVFVPSYYLDQIARAIVGADTMGTVIGHAAVLVGMTAAAAVWAWSGWRRSAA